MKHYRNSLNNEIYYGDRLYYSDTLVDDLAGCKALQKQRITESRYQEEVSGKTLDGVFYDTDRTTQVMLGNAFSLVQFDPEITEVDWKSSDGSWTKVSKEHLLEMAKIVGRHVQDCFSKECRLHKLIDACETKEEVLKVVWEE